MNFVFLFTGLLLGFALSWLYNRSQQKNTAVDGGAALRLAELDKEKSIAEDRLRAALADYEETLKELVAERERTSNSSIRLAKAEEAFLNMQEKLDTQKKEVDEMQKRFSTEFENVANRLLEEKSKKFTEQNKENLDGILKPLSEKIKDFEKKVNDVYVAESKERASLKEQLSMLHQLNQQMSKEAQSLTRALKGESKTQGNWGEMILESILERSGLVKDREFFTQQSFSNEEGSRQQPDVVIRLPEGKHLVVDSKVSLTAYQRFHETDDEEERIVAVKEHILSVRKHLKDLSEKKYHDLYDLKSLDFVLMFIPVEPAFALAVQNDHQLFNDAFDKNIVIVSPSTLLATTRTVASIWRQENQNRYAVEIARQGGALYDKFVGFVDDLIAVGKKMDEAKTNYAEAMKKLHEGSGNLVKRSEELKKLGAKASKNLPSSLVEKADTD